MLLLQPPSGMGKNEGVNALLLEPTGAVHLASLAQEEDRTTAFRADATRPSQHVAVLRRRRIQQNVGACARCKASDLSSYYVVLFSPIALRDAFRSHERLEVEEVPSTGRPAHATSLTSPLRRSGRSRTRRSATLVPLGPAFEISVSHVSAFVRVL